VNDSNHDLTIQNAADRTETGQCKSQKTAQRSFSKTHVDYWRGRIRKRSYRADEGEVVEIPNWQVRLFHGGKEDWFNLATANKGEIDYLEWRMLDFDKNLICLEETEWLHLKTQDSAAEIPVDVEVMQELRVFMPGSKPQFVLTSDRPPRNDSGRPYYRCAPTFARLNAWLRSKGVQANKPLHELRKPRRICCVTFHLLPGVTQRSCTRQKYS
jgi:hypothetical protein